MGISQMRRRIGLKKGPSLKRKEKVDYEALEFAEDLTQEYDVEENLVLELMASAAALANKALRKPGPVAHENQLLEKVLRPSNVAAIIPLRVNDDI